MAGYPRAFAGFFALTTGANRRTRMELMRLALPRRTYTDKHLEFVALAITRLYEQRADIHGVEFASEAAVLRHFSSTFRLTGSRGPRPESGKGEVAG